MQHFRPAKGWKKEIEEISLGFVIAVLIFVAGTAKVASAFGGGGVLFWGRVIYMYECIDGGAEAILDTDAGNTFCVSGSMSAPYVVIATTGNQPFVGLIPFQSLGKKRDAQSASWIMGFGIPGAVFKASKFWMY